MKYPSRPYQPKTGRQRDNCGQCEGTGWVIDFAAIRHATRPDKFPPPVPKLNVKPEPCYKFNPHLPPKPNNQNTP